MSTTLTALNPMPPATRRVRAYFAPVTRSTQTPTVFDPSVNGLFSLSSPPAPWVDLGWIEDFSRKSLSKTGTLVTGSPGTTQYQVRESVDASVSFRFKTWSKLTMALSAGSQHMNLLAPATGATQNASGSKAAAAIALATTGSTATFLYPSSTAGFAAGDIVAVDADYAGQTGFVGTGVSAAYVSSAAAVNDDPDYIRRVTFNVARVTQVTTSGLQLASALIGGAPAGTMKVQQVLGFVDREGGNFFQEWSGLFVMPGEQGERIVFYYPRLQAMIGAAETTTTLVAPLERIALSASFRALPVTDTNDGQTVVCFRSYLPSAMTLV
ncbi:hypothetical protein [Silvibacterium dinghuense]|uniref:Uncharacterized protein n=1 Tax=Silvibacterium dinghuense TaxID=1560006 RepID=A0A4Q1SJY2_9BACT|nr:hypothetical protein [Silvibacterium dinghuense]RXS97753.1 hypothetical protein ESZ00_07790 [Silvibacterium dinghuense]GGH01751.1 hypothetical protein GCM10011586_16780 [Silvibacterium dinghuense]